MKRKKTSKISCNSPFNTTIQCPGHSEGGGWICVGSLVCGMEKGEHLEASHVPAKETATGGRGRGDRRKGTTVGKGRTGGPGITGGTGGIKGTSGTEGAV